jgi:flagellar biosynthesis protein FlhA
VEFGRYEIPPGSDLAIPNASAGPTRAAPPDGIPTREPAFGIDAWWIPSSTSDRVRAAGFTVVDAVSVLGTHLAELARRHAHELFTRQDAKKYLDRVTEENPKLVEDLVPKLVPLSLVQRVLQNLLREQVSIRDAVSILESLGEGAPVTRNAVLLTEFVRQGIRRTVIKPHLRPDGQLAAYFLDPALENTIESAIEHSEHSSQLALAPQQVRDLIDRMSRAIGANGGTPLPVTAVVVCSSPGRYFLKQILEPTLAGVSVIGHGEIPDGVRIVSLGLIRP